MRFLHKKKFIIYILLFIQIAKRFDSLNEQMSPTNDHFKCHSITYECPLNYEWPFQVTKKVVKIFTFERSSSSRFLLLFWSLLKKVAVFNRILLLFWSPLEEVSVVDSYYFFGHFWKKLLYLVEFYYFFDHLWKK